jgi:hypothetical protein
VDRVDRVGEGRSVVVVRAGPLDPLVAYTGLAVGMVRRVLGVEPARWEHGVEMPGEAAGRIAAAEAYLGAVGAAGAALDAADARTGRWPLRWAKARCATVRTDARAAYRSAVDTAEAACHDAVGTLPSDVLTVVLARKRAERDRERDREDARRRALDAADAAVWRLLVEDRHAWIRRDDVEPAAGTPAATKPWTGPYGGYRLALELAHLRSVDEVTWDDAAVTATREGLAAGRVGLDEWWDAHAASAGRAVRERDDRRRGGYSSGSFI